MIITDFNKMTLKELEALNQYLGVEIEINDGKITNAKQGDE